MPVRLSIPSLICKTTCFQDSIDDTFFCEDIHNLVSNFFVINFVMDYKIKCHNRQRCLFAFPRHLVLWQLLSTCLILRFIVFRIVFEKQTVTTRVKSHSTIKNHTIRNQATSSILFENFIKNLTTGSDKVTWTKKDAIINLSDIQNKIRFIIKILSFVIGGNTLPSITTSTFPYRFCNREYR